MYEIYRMVQLAVEYLCCFWRYEETLLKRKLFNTEGVQILACSLYYHGLIIVTNYVFLRKMFTMVKNRNESFLLFFLVFPDSQHFQKQSPTSNVIKHM